MRCTRGHLCGKGRLPIGLLGNALVPLGVLDEQMDLGRPWDQAEARSRCACLRVSRDVKT